MPKIAMIISLMAAKRSPRARSGLWGLRKAAVLAGVIAAIPANLLADNPAATVTVDAGANRHAISPLIYGANWADQATVSDLNLSVNRRGGNATSNYNWQVNATNHAADWYFESLTDGSDSTPSGGPDAFIAATKAAGGEPMITIPLMDWIAKLGPNRSSLSSFSISKYGAQASHDPWFPDAGNGVKASDGTNVTGNDPNDAYVPNSSSIQQAWVQHLVGKFGSSSGGGVKYYIMDNEHGVWPAEHRDLMTQGPTMETIRDKIIDYAGKVKAADPSAQIVGPEEWGWPNYFLSSYDTSVGGNTDRNAHGGMDYMPWLLSQMKANNDATGQRLLDIFSLHYYPQYNEFNQGDSSTAAQLKRNESTRDLWDVNYVSSSWINASVHLIPRMKDWVNTYYPGTKIAITEYSWGAESHISGATAEADVLGIFGREGVDLATFWGSLTSTYPICNAFKMYRNYDGNKSTFGDTSVSASVANPDNVAAFAAQRGSDGALTVMVVCKYLSGNTPITVNIANFAAANACQVWQLTSSNTITRLADTTASNGSVSFNAPSQSITLLVIPQTAPDDSVAHYPFDGDATDTSGNGFHGTATALTFAAGRIGAQAGQFDGISSYVSIPRSVTDDFTVSMWVKTTDTSGAASGQWWSGKALVDGDVSGGGADWGTSIVNGKFALGVGSPTGDVTVASTVNVNDGNWHHVAATRSNSSGAMQVYVDGMLQGSGSGPTGSRTSPPALRIGALASGAGNFLSGTIDDVRLYGRILTSAEITALAEAQLPAPDTVTATPSTAKITLSWSAVSGATGYTVRRSGSSGGTYTDLATGISGTTYSDSGLADGATWYYTVGAEGLPGLGAFTPPVSATTYTALENWRLANFGSIANSGMSADSADPDGDGQTNLQEFTAGTDPNNRSSALGITQTQTSGNDVIVSFPTAVGKLYRLESSDTLQTGSWTPVQDHIAGTGGMAQVADSGAAGVRKRFYRIVIE